jgi:hypothetical protein
MLRMARYGKTRFWALWDDHELVAVVVYKKGAAELLRRLAAQPPAARAGSAWAGLPADAPPRPAGAPPVPTSPLPQPVFRPGGGWSGSG